MFLNWRTLSPYQVFQNVALFYQRVENKRGQQHDQHPESFNEDVEAEPFVRFGIRVSGVHAPLSAAQGMAFTDAQIAKFTAQKKAPTFAGAWRIFLSLSCG